MLAVLLLLWSEPRLLATDRLLLPRRDFGSDRRPLPCWPCWPCGAVARSSSSSVPSMRVPRMAACSSTDCRRVRVVVRRRAASLGRGTRKTTKGDLRPAADDECTDTTECVECAERAERAERAELRDVGRSS